MNKGGKTKAEYDKAYNARPDQLKKRAMRNAARREYEKENGNLPSNVDVDHKKMLDSGGTNDKKNLRAVDQKTNRGWRKGNNKNYG